MLGVMWCDWWAALTMSESDTIAHPVSTDYDTGRQSSTRFDTVSTDYDTPISISISHPALALASVLASALALAVA